MIKTENLNLIKIGDLEFIQFPKLYATNAVKHAFSTRKGGVSTGQCSSMNLSFNRNDKRENVLKNYQIICSSVGIEIENLVLSAQTHTNNVITVTKSDCSTGVSKPPFKDVDGLVTNEKGVALVTQYADCTPLLFCDAKRGVIGTSHAGWRGTVKLIGRVTVEKMVNEFGCKASDIVVGIGPCIGACCYEVDDPVYNEFLKIDFLDFNRIFTHKDNGHYMLNLVEANKQILINAGISEQNIDCSDICTCCNCDDFHSHRATAGKRGNLAAIIELK